MTTDPNGWRPGEPGVPKNPEQDGQHWMTRNDRTPYVMRWNAKRQRWESYDYHDSIAPASMQRFGWRYLGPCLTPAEVVTREAAAFQRGAEAMREAAASHALKYRWRTGPADVIAAAIRALPLPGDEKEVEA